MDDLSHVDKEGRPSMVDISAKKPQHRTARASGMIDLAGSTVALIADNKIKKGNVLGLAETAGIQAAKRTSELIPLCHPLQIGRIDVKAELVKNGVTVTAVVNCIDRTGVEMEALTGVSVALLTIYDMCKAVDKNMKIHSIVLEEKEKHDA